MNYFKESIENSKSHTICRQGCFLCMFDSDIMGKLHELQEKPTLTILCTEHFQEFLSLDVESV